jgi:glycosyltransferase involved in cell wall biosynthesis
LVEARARVLAGAAPGLGAAGAAHVRREHAWDRLAERTLAIYEEGLRAR